MLSEGGLQVEEPVHHDVTSKYSEDATIAQFVKEQLAHLGDAHLQTMAITETQLDGRFVSIRTKETGLGNFICDASKYSTNPPDHRPLFLSRSNSSNS